MTTVLVTGANGFVGQHVCRWFCDRGWTVRAAMRPDRPTGGLPRGAAIQPVEEPHRSESWQEAAAGADAVVHLIGLSHERTTGAGEEAFTSVNVGITRAVLAAAAAEGVPRTVYLSSIKALGESREAPYAEDSRPAPEDAYGRSKLEAERCALSMGGAVLRPPLVYGPGVKGNFRRLLAAAASAWPLPLGRAQAPRSLIHVENLAAALAALVVTPGVDGEVFHATDGPPLGVADVVRRLRQEAGRPAMLVPVPTTVVEIAGALLSRQDQIERLFHPLVVNDDKLGITTGWERPHSTTQGLAQTMRWYLAGAGT